MGVHYGKCSADHAGANFKRFVLMTVKAGKVTITNCFDLAEYATLHYKKQTLCPHYIKLPEIFSGNTDSEDANGKNPHSLFKVIYSEKIPRNKLEENLRPVVGTCKLHSIHNTGEEDILKKRDMSCNCNGCTYGEGDCQFSGYADPWIAVSVTGHTKKFLSKFKNTWHDKEMKLKSAWADMKREAQGMVQKPSR